MKSFPYDSIPTTDTSGNVTYDRYVLAATERALNKAMYTDGIFANPLGAEVVVSENMTVDVSPVICQVNGLRAYEDETTQWTFDDSDTLDRIDRLVIRGDISTEIRDTFFYIIKGTPAESPVAPDRLTGTMISDIVIADVKIKANSTAISQANITDQRLNSDLCGAVTQTMTTIDTSTIFDQLQSQVDENIALIQSAIDETTEGILQTQIDTNASDIETIATVVDNNVNNISANADSISDLEDGTTQSGNSAKLGGQLPSYFVKETELTDGTKDVLINKITSKYFGLNIISPNAPFRTAIDNLYYGINTTLNFKMETSSDIETVAKMPEAGGFFGKAEFTSIDNIYVFARSVSTYKEYTLLKVDGSWGYWTMVSSGHSPGESILLYSNNNFDGLENVSLGDISGYSSIMCYYNDDVSTSASGVVNPTIIPTSLLLSGAIPKFSCFVYNNQTTEAIYSLTIQYFTSTNKFLITGVQGSNITIYGIY